MASLPHKRVEGAALVTGAGSGIGHAVSIALALAGISTLHLVDIRSSGLDNTKNSILSLPLPTYPEIILHESDVSCVLSTTQLFSQIPRLDYAVNCAGVLGPSKPALEISIAEFDNVNDINFRAFWMCQKEELKLMLKNDIRPFRGYSCLNEEDAQVRGQRGAIVNVASQLGIVGKARTSIYSATKAAVLAITRGDALDYSRSPHHVRINAVCPGFIATAMTAENGEVKEDIKEAVRLAPMERIGLPSEVADTVVFLCSGDVDLGR
ncbi:NAD(P)-binding protein [Westerdykella ornata]|uniref:NAD(P)-binding protein n=1 Tax=Westerdykella ornata TaxID=318751 RepID=A0A6A6JBS1_WESOR|nr:NAD(P)-binding protein [Westerdykella ornata]KAF2274060.1 NAD(P)-binding protein [Westerdykella ornata]